MPRTFRSLPVALLAGVASVAAAALFAQTPAPPIDTSRYEDPDFDVDAAVARLEQAIAGREQQPAGEVFENIKRFEKVPAARLLKIMQYGFDRSLGVNCTFCHDPSRWASDDKPEKRTARQMIDMVKTINQELLAEMPEIRDDEPTVNCTTCHRGHVEPATELEEPPAPAPPAPAAPGGSR